ncbi:MULTISPECIES: ATP-binding protein [unclassified Streptomyces]|uniref:ATP-binding protein n=1 Tax=unclassified Streptomyces TaxID=2593676 RepID=UPI002E2874F3|nr:NB-ARC domain-containing protein [Streptomyces sp. NBC_00223]
MRQPLPDPTGPVTEAAAAVRTLDGLALLLRDLRRRHARRRQDSTLTYRELAARTGWSQTAIAEYFTARTLPPTDRLDGLLELLGATPAEQRALATARDRVEEAARRARRGGGARTAPPGEAPSALGGPDRAPHQLPAPPDMFTGRVRELSLLDTAAGGDRHPGDGAGGVCAIGGMGGIGKTWLALHWAHSRRDRFPDGELHVDLRGFDPTGRPLDPELAVRGFLEALGVAPDAVPTGPEAQTALYRSLTADRRMLVLLDNALDTAQAAPLLPGGSACTVLITSRRRLTGLIAAHGARAVALGVLPEDEAREVLVRRLGRSRLNAEPRAAAELIARCAGLPLALGIAAACAATHPGLSLAALAGELRDDADRLDALDGGEPGADLRAVLSWSGRALSPADRRRFGLLSIAPGPDITPAAAAHLLDLPPAAARRLLRALDHAHLVQRHAPERYRMHDLLRLHATEQAHEHGTTAELRAAVRRLVDFHTATACAAARLLAPHHPPLPTTTPTAPPPLAPAADFPRAPSTSGALVPRGPAPGAPAAGGSVPRDTAPPRVPEPPGDQVAAMGWFDVEHANLLAAQQAAHRHGWDAQVCRLAWALDPFHRRRGHFAEQAAAWQLAVESAARLRDAAAQAHAHQMLGDACALLGRTADALRHLSRALELAESTSEAAVRAEIHHSLGGAWERHGDDRRALEHALRALAIFRTLDDTYRQARALNGVGWLRTRLGDHAGARADCLAALALLRRHPADRRQLGESSTLDSLGCVAHRLREYDAAVAYFRQALAICRAQGHSHLEADVLRHTAAALLARHSTEEARETLLRARALLTAQHRLADAADVGRELAGLAPPPSPPSLTGKEAAPG